MAPKPQSTMTAGPLPRIRKVHFSTFMPVSQMTVTVRACEQPMSTVLVGPHKKRFVIYQEFPTNYSAFFRAALTGPFEEAKKRLVELPDMDAEILEMFVHWLYYQQVPGRSPYDDEPPLALWTDTRNSEKDARVLLNLVHLYVLADKYDIHRFRRNMIDEVFERYQFNDTTHRVLPGPTTINRAIENLSERSPMCRLLIDITCRWSNAERLTHNDDTIKNFTAPF